MAKTESYRDKQRHELEGVVAALDLSDLQKRFLLARWLDQVLWLEAASVRAMRWYYGLRVIMVVGGAIVPALVSLQAAGERLTGAFASTVSVTAFLCSLLVAIAASLEGLYRFGERYRHYRRTVEWLKIEGWQFFQLADRYHRDGAGHSAVYPLFAGRVEAAIGQDVDAYVTQVVREPQPQKEEAT